MSFFGTVRHMARSFFTKSAPLPLPGEGERPADRDTLSAIHDLSRLVRNDPEAVDIYLALGNLFRAQGDIERAVMIREGLILRHGLNTQYKARSYFELGVDYQRSGLIDRAFSAFKEAVRLGYSEAAVTAELAALFADSHDFASAAEEYQRLGHSLAQAHYMVRLAEETAASGDAAKALRLIKKALRVYPGSVEGWCALVCMAALAHDWRKTAAHLQKGLEKITPSLRFLVLEALLDIHGKTYAASKTSPEDMASFAQTLCETVLPVLEKHEPHLLLHFYGALLLRQANDLEGVDIWLAKTLVIQPDFWAARLEALLVAAEKEEIPAVATLQVASLAEQLRHIRRFICTVCGLRQNSVFYRCPRCGSWHSLSFRLSLKE